MIVSPIDRSLVFRQSPPSCHPAAFPYDALSFKPPEPMSRAPCFAIRAGYQETPSKVKAFGTFPGRAFAVLSL